MSAPRVSEHRRWRNRPVAHEVDQARTRSTWTAVGALVLALAPFTAYGFMKNECINLNYSIEELQDRHGELIERARRLNVRRSELESLERVERWALRRGLVRPGAQQVRVYGTAVEAKHVVD